MKHKKRYRYTFILIFLFGVLPLAFTYFKSVHNKYIEILSFDDCVKAGIPVTATYPEVCKIPGKKFTNPRQTTDSAVNLNNSPVAEKPDPKSQSYYIDGQMVKMVDGFGLLPANTALGSVTSTIMVLEGSTMFDINQDSIDDYVVLLVQKTQKPYLDYYIASLLSLNKGYTGSNAVYLGQDIASTTAVLKNNEFQISYTMKKGKEKEQASKKIIFKDNLLQEVTY